MPCPKFPHDMSRDSYQRWRLKLGHWVWQMRRAGVCDSLLGNELLTRLSGAPNGAEEMIAKLPPEVLGFPGVAPNWLLGFAGVRSGIMEAVNMLDTKFGVDVFDEGIANMQRFYDLFRKGPMSYYIADFENAYGDASVNADLMVNDSAKA